MATSYPLQPPRYSVALTLSGVRSTALPGRDRCLPGGGWPLGEISERVGQDEVPLRLPALLALSWEAHWLTLIRPPETIRPLLGQPRGLDRLRFRHAHPCVSPLANASRAARQSAAVVVGADRVSQSAIVRLRAALANTDTLVFLIRPETALSQTPIGTLRLQVDREPTEGFRILPVAWSRQAVLSLCAAAGALGAHREGRVMKRLLSYPALHQENRRFAGSGGVSRENRAQGFVPAFYDTRSHRTVISRFANGATAPIHLLEGLPAEWVVARDACGRVTAVKDSIIAGFLRQGKFYTREQAAQAVRH